MRARNIKPDFFLNEKLAEVSAHERLLFIGLWCLADREGRLEDRPKRIRAALFPYEDVDMDSMLDRLQRAGLAIRYEVERENYIAIPGFSKHQQPHYKEPASVIPAPQDGPSPTAVPAMIAPSSTDDPLMIDRSSTDDPPMIDRSLTNDRSKKVLDDPLIPDSPLLIPDCLIPDSLISDCLIPDSPLRIPSVAKTAAEDVRMDFFHPTKQTTNHESTTNRYESLNPCASPPNEDSIGEEPTDPLYPPEFEQFWQQYPRQTEKKQAFRIWQTRIKDRVDAHDLIRAAQHYAAYCRRRRTDPDYIKHPSTFLGPLQVFKDWIEPTRKGRGNGDGRRPDDEEDLSARSF